MFMNLLDKAVDHPILTIIIGIIALSIFWNIFGIK